MIYVSPYTINFNFLTWTGKKAEYNKCESRHSHKSVSNPREPSWKNATLQARSTLSHRSELVGWRLEKRLGDGSSSRKNDWHVRRWTEKPIKAGVAHQPKDGDEIESVMCRAHILWGGEQYVSGGKINLIWYATEATSLLQPAEATPGA